LIVKEFLAALRDPKARALLIGPPILQIFIFSFAITQEVKNVTLAVYNQDVGKEGAVLIQRFQHSPTFTRILHLSHRGEINPVLDNQETMAVLVIPQDFSRELYAGRKTTVQLLLDGRKSNAAPIVGGYASKIINKFVREMHGMSVGINLETRHWFNVNLDPRKTTIPSLICVLAMVLGIIIAGLSIARERETGTFEQLLVSPLTPTEILLGKAIPALVLATCSAVMLIGIAIFMLGIPLQGSFFLLLASLMLFLLSIIGIGLFVSSLSLTQQQAILGVILVMPPCILLSGFATPVENMPDWLQWLTLINPARWFLMIVKGVFLKGMGATEAFWNCIPLVLIALATMSAANVMFRRRME
jgi:ABC-2 type transport system permease protein